MGPARPRLTSLSATPGPSSVVVAPGADSRPARCRAATSRQPTLARAPSPATCAPGGSLACLVGRVQPPAKAPSGPGPRPTLPRRPAHDPRSGARNHAPSGPSTQPPGTGPDHTELGLIPLETAARRPEVSLPIASIRRTRDETAATERTDRHQTAGRRTVGHQPAGQLRPDEGASWPDPGRAGHRAAGHSDLDGGPGWVDTQQWTPPGDGQQLAILASPPRRRGPSRWDVVQKLRLADVAWADPQSGQLSSRRSCRELTTATPDWSRWPPPWSAAGSAATFAG
jgi:hypothetical protein